MITRLAAVILLMVGLLLVVFMIVTESEPGALPLFMVIAGMIACWRTHKGRRLD
jgi:hypothetical protein